MQQNARIYTDPGQRLELEFSDQPQHTIRSFTVRWHQEFHAGKGCLIEDRAQFGEGQKALVAVIMPHTAAADTTEIPLVG